MAWSEDQIGNLIADISDQAAAWATWASGRPVVTPTTSIVTTQQQIDAQAGALAAQQYPLATYALASPTLSFGVIALVALLLIMVLRK
jgi:hypothetical protein